MPIIGLTGNFGMGKSTVLKLFNRLGALTYNVDDFVHHILADPKTVKRIARVLGSGVLLETSKDISLDKKRIADIIFDDHLKRKAVEKIIHPPVLKEIKATGSKILRKDPAALIIFEVPLLFEAGYENIFDQTIVVYCKRGTAVDRLVKKGFSRDDALKRIRSQIPITEKKKLADILIDNNDGIKRTETRVKKVFDRLSCM